MQLSFIFSYLKFFIQIIFLLESLDTKYLCSHKSLEYPISFPCYYISTAVWIYII